MSTFLKYWLPLLVWMLVIFSASSDVMSSGHTSRIIGPLLRWLIPGISEAAVGQIVFTVRKTAHVTEYAILAALFWRAWRGTSRASQRRECAPLADASTSLPHPWRWSEALLALGVAALYATSDEIHQYFVPSRQAAFGDVLLDTAGAAAGLLGIWTAGRCWRRW